MVRAADLVYHLLYGGVLSRLPESIAVPLGQWALRLVPLDLLPVFRNDDPRLAVTLGGVSLPNPMILSSMYYDTAILRRAMGLGFGAVTAQEHHPEAAPGASAAESRAHHPPRGPGLVNCNGFHNPGLEAYRREVARLPTACRSSSRPRASRRTTTCAVVEGLAPFGDLVEINISSPNTKLVYGWSERPHALAAVFRAVRKATDKPIIVKVSPDFRAPTRHHNPRRARRGHHHHQLRQRASRGRAAPLAKDRRTLGARAVRAARSTTCNGCENTSRDSIEIIATAASTPPTKPSRVPRGRDRVRVLHRIHHARPVPSAENPRRARQSAK